LIYDIEANDDDECQFLCPWPEKDSDNNIIGFYIADMKGRCVRYLKLGDTTSQLVFDGSQNDDSQSDADDFMPKQIELHQDKQGKTVGIFINNSPWIIYWKIGATESIKIPVGGGITYFCLQKDLHDHPIGLYLSDEERQSVRYMKAFL